MKKYYDTVILGATFLGLGAALAKGKDVAVIEKGSLFGAEYVDCFRSAKETEFEPKTMLGQHFFAELKARGLVAENGQLYQAPAVYVLSSFLKEKEIDIYMMTEVISIEKTEAGYRITIFNTQGFSTIETKRILDTTNLGTGHNLGKTIAWSKSLNVILYNPDKQKLEGLSFNSASGLYFYKMPVEQDISRYEAMERLVAMEKELTEKNMRISAIAQEFAYDLEPVMKQADEHFIWQPSCAYINLTEAYDKGVALMEGGTL